MRIRLFLPLLALGLTACPNNGTNAQRRDAGPDGGPPLGNFTLYTLDTSKMPNGNSDLMSDTVPQLTMAVASDDTVGIAFIAPNSTVDAGLGVQSYDVRYLTWKNGITGTAQTVTTIQNFEGLSLAFQPNGSPAISYLGGTYQGALGATSFYWFQAEAAISYATGGPGAGTWGASVVAAPGDDNLPGGAQNLCTALGKGAIGDKGLVVGLDTALIFVNGNAQLAYRDVHYGQASGSGTSDFGASDLRFVSGSPGSWAYQVIDCESFSQCGNTTGAGGHTQMVVGTDGYGALVQDGQTDREGAGNGVYFRKQNSNLTWSAPPCNKGPFADLAAGGVFSTLSGPTLATDPILGYAVAVYNESNSTLYYTQPVTPSNPLDAWDTSDPGPQGASGSLGWYPSVAVDPVLHEPSIAFFYCSATPGKVLSECSQNEAQLRLSTRVGSNWMVQVVDPGGGIQPHMAYLSTGKRVIVYKDSFTGYTKLAVEN
jgi:hypothetical protein